jgi:hypothetical protein
MRWDVRNFRIITTPCHSLKAIAEDFRRAFEAALESALLNDPVTQSSHRDSGPLAMPFATVNEQRFTPNQYGISR